MTVTWQSEIADFYSAEHWHVWDAAGRGQQCYGLAETAEEAKDKAECALEALTQQLGLVA